MLRKLWKRCLFENSSLFIIFIIFFFFFLEEVESLVMLFLHLPFCVVEFNCEDYDFREEVADAADVPTIGKIIMAQKLPACHPNTYNITLLSVT